MTKTEMIREELRLMLSMDPNDVYLSYKDAVNKKDMVQILTDQNPRFNREQMLDLLEDLGFRVGNMRKKPMDDEAKAKWHREHPNNGKTSFDGNKEDVPAPAKVFIITQEMLDVANALQARQTEIEELLDQIDVLRKRAAELGFAIK